MRYILYNADRAVAAFEYSHGMIVGFEPIEKTLLPMQLRNASADGFTLWLRERTMDLNCFQHRQLASKLFGSRDKTAIAVMTHMFSISDTFTCFAEDEFIPRDKLCRTEDQDIVSDFILVSSDTSLRRNNLVTPNASTDGSFPKTWKYEGGEWWLYKIQSPDATCSECEISHALMECNWDAAEYQYVGDNLTRIRSKNFVNKDEFFEPYDSLRFMFTDKSDDEAIIYENLASLGAEFEMAYRRILLADALFTNTDRHMRNFGVMRSAKTGEILCIAPNFDNNQAYKSNPGGRFSDSMLRSFNVSFGITEDDRIALNTLINACSQNQYMYDAAEIGKSFLNII